MAASVLRSRHCRRSALSQSSVRDKSLRSSFCLSLSELPAGISARPPHPTHDRLSRLLSKTQPRRFRSAVSIKAHDEIVAVFVSKTELTKQALAAASASTTLPVI